jgi:hypothetical protein
MSTQTLSDGQRIETSEIFKIELLQEHQNLLVTLKDGRIVGVHGDGVVGDTNMLESLKKKEHLAYPVYR